MRDGSSSGWRRWPGSAARCSSPCRSGSPRAPPRLSARRPRRVLLLALAAIGVHPRPPATVDGRDCVRVDTDAQLRGELRSAHWFSTTGRAGRVDVLSPQPRRDRAAQVSWRELYPRESGTRAWVMSGVCAVAGVALAVIVPQRHLARRRRAVESTAKSTVPRPPSCRPARRDARENEGRHAAARRGDAGGAQEQSRQARSQAAGRRSTS